MAKKSIKLFRSGENYGAAIYDGSKKSSWENLTKQEQEDLLGAMASMYALLSRFVKEGEDETQ